VRVLLIHGASAIGFGVDASATQPADAGFDASVAPLLARRCLECHNSFDKKGGLDLSRQEAATAGGESGPVIVPAMPDESLLWQRIAAGEMPPDQPLEPAERELLRDWIASGATWGSSPIDVFRFTTDRRAGYDWWALRPLAVPPLPSVRDRQWGRNEIDAFVLSRLDAEGLTPAPPASRRVLIRRLYFDLVGLPPTAEEVEDFASDPADDSYLRLVDRLLDSPHYGERQARHWLDVVRFGESQGFERDKLRPTAWRFRDWVVQAFNDDLPYDEFIRLQVAGDVLRPDDPLAVAATGFLVAGPWDEVGQTQQSAAMRAVVRQDELEELVALVGQTFLGLTVNCARCHDHKFDPISQRDYYSLAAAVGGARHGERETLTEAGRNANSAQREELARRASALVEELASLDPAQGVDVAGRGDELRFQISRIETRLALESGGPAYCVRSETPESFHILARGNPAQPGESVWPRGISSVTGPPAEWNVSTEAPDAVRRVALARWLSHPENPLASRVIVNRLWQWHFGAGLVETPNDFGFNGSRPSHPDLVDYLASRLVAAGWSLKALHRLIVTSSTYMQSSRVDPRAAQVDLGNRLLWRKSPVRLEAEAIRDAMLVAAGRLNREMGGPGFQDFRTFSNNSQFYEPLDPIGPAFERRSLYRTWVRSGRNRFLDVLDCPDPSTVTPRRVVTTTPLAALAMSNHSFVLRMADALSDRIRMEVGENAEAQVDRAFELCFGRSPELDEAPGCREFVSRHGLPALARVLFNANEFVYVD
jgi:hypothetical protein